MSFWKAVISGIYSDICLQTQEKENGKIQSVIFQGSYRFVKLDKTFFWTWSGKLGYFRKNPNRKVVIFSGMPIQEFPKNAPSESGKIGFLLFVDILLPLSTMLVHHDSHC